MFTIVTRGRMEAEINNRRISIQGEGYRPRPGASDPDFVVFTFSIKKWDDGSDVTDVDLDAILDDLRSCAVEEGIVLEFE
jgi:hypothetical protein